MVTNKLLFILSELRIVFHRRQWSIIEFKFYPSILFIYNWFKTI